MMDIRLIFKSLNQTIMIPEDIFIKIVRIAAKAPSSHNTQPWVFIKEKDGISIEPDYSRTLSVADPDNRELFISVGCATETAMIASKFYGYNPILNIESLREDIKVKIMLSKTNNENQTELFPYIKSRQTTRNLSKTTSFPADDIEKLRKAIFENGVNIHFFFDQNEVQQFSPYITEANAIQVSNPAFNHFGQQSGGLGYNRNGFPAIYIGVHTIRS
jgi:hypothetical protein